MANTPDTSCGKMSPEPSPQTKEMTSIVSSKASAKPKTKGCLFLDMRSGRQPETSWEMISPLHGESSMLNFGEYPKDENESSLSQILQAGVPGKYFLSQKACQGILRRASVRGKELPAVLKAALMRQASMDTTEV